MSLLWGKGSYHILLPQEGGKLLRLGVVRGSTLGGASVPQYKRLLLPVTISWGKEEITLQAFIDSGSAANFISHEIVSKWGIPLLPLKKKVYVTAIDDSLLQENVPLSQTPPLTCTTGVLHEEELQFFVLHMSSCSMILGLPWLIKHAPVIDWASGQLSAWSPYCHSNCMKAITLSSLSVTVKGLPRQYTEYSDVFCAKEADKLPPHRSFDCAIELRPGTMPPRGRLYNLSGPERGAMKEYIKENLEKGFIQPSKSPAGAGFFFVQKKDGGLRPCIDYRGLNQITVKNRYPLPLIDELFSLVTGARIFTKLDLRGAYNLIRIRQGDEWKTAFNTQEGHYEYLVMPFGLCNAPAVFQEFVNEIFREVLGKFVLVYLDDILIFSNNIEEHRSQVKYVLQKLRDNSLYAKLEKCMFEVTELPFLGYIISSAGLLMDPKKVSAVMEWPQPVGLKALQRFLGFSNYYRKFIKGFSSLVAPLTDLTKKGADCLNWSPKACAAFTSLKTAFCSAPILRHPDVTQPFIVEVDASEIGVGAVLSQYAPQGRLHPCAFFSRKFSPAEKNYDIGNRELLAIKMAFEEWRHWLEGADHVVTVFTDHKNLEYLENAKRLNPRQARWALFFSRFKFIITYKPGDKNIKADALSRCFDPETHVESVPEKILPDHVVVAVIDSSEDLVESLTEFQAEAPENKPEGLLFVPEQFRSQVLQFFHSHKTAGHPGIARTQELLSRCVWWPSISNDAKDFVSSCAVCARCKTSRRAPSGTLQPLPIPLAPWTHVSMDFVGELPSSEGKTIIWVVVDRFSKMAHFIPLEKLPSAQELADLFVTHIFRLHGIPVDVVSDRGVQFVSKFWKAFCASLEMTLSFSSGFHPQSNGQTERTNQSMEQFLRCYVSDVQLNWVRFLPFAEFAHNNLQNASSGFSPFQVVFGRSPKFTPIAVNNSTFPALEEWQEKLKSIWASVNKNLKKATLIQKEKADRKRTIEWKFAPGDMVYVSTRHIALRQPSAKLGPKFIGPYPILEKINEVSYRVDLPSSMKGVKTFHVSLLKPAVRIGPPPPPPPPVMVDGEQEYEVEQILDSRRVRSSLQYLIHWKGYGPEERSWEPANRIHAEELIREFHLLHPHRPSMSCSETTPQGRGTVTQRGLTSAAAGGESAASACDVTAGFTASCPASSGEGRAPSVLNRQRAERSRGERQLIYSLRRRVS